MHTYHVIAASCWGCIARDGIFLGFLQSRRDVARRVYCAPCAPLPPHTLVPPPLPCASRPIRKILIANNGMAATKSIMSMRQWAYMEVRGCGLALM